RHISTRSCCHRFCTLFCFFFNAAATTEIYTLSLHDALPIYPVLRRGVAQYACGHSPAPAHRPRDLFRGRALARRHHGVGALRRRSEEHTSELQSQSNLVCRLLLEKKKS